MFNTWGTRWRSSYWLVTFAVGWGIAADLSVYSIIILVLPFHLSHLNYSGVSGLLGWLLFAYSAGLVLATIPIAVLSEKYKSRIMPLIVGLVALIGSQIMLMEAPTYWVMVIARFMQGLSTAMEWVVGLALLCDCTPPHILGRQLGIAMTGHPDGDILGPPLGGLYDRFGFRGPMILGIAVAFVGFIGPLIVIEPRELERLKATNNSQVSARPQEIPTVPISDGLSSLEVGEDGDNNDTVSEMSQQPASQRPKPSEGILARAETPASLRQVLVRLAKSRRALCAMLFTLFDGLVFSMIEPALPLHLEKVWGFDATLIGVVIVAGFTPSLISPIAGYLSDKFGPEWIMTIGLAVSSPWWILLIIQQKLWMFITSLAFARLTLSAILSPVMAELASVPKHVEGVGFAHVYGAFIVASGVGSVIGPIIGGQVYDHIQDAGWMIICATIAGALLSCIPLLFLWTGEVPLWTKMMKKMPHE